jgi:hypothetical protein
MSNEMVRDADISRTWQYSQSVDRVTHPT